MRFKCLCTNICTILALITKRTVALKDLKRHSRKVQYVLLQNNGSSVRISSKNISRIPLKAEQNKWATGTQSVDSSHRVKISARSQSQ